jgi:hypothetical protein
MFMAMKRLQIMIEPELDHALTREAARQGMSKGALIRLFVRKNLDPLPPLEEDPLWGFVGADGDAEPAQHDDVVYPR